MEESMVASANMEAMHNCFTVCLRNVPAKYTQKKFGQDVDSEGFAGKYNFLYLPSERKRHRAHRGFAFINFLDPADSQKFHARFHMGWLPRFSDGEEHPLMVYPADLQGFAANAQRAGAVVNKRCGQTKPIMHRIPRISAAASGNNSSIDELGANENLFLQLDATDGACANRSLLSSKLFEEPQFVLPSALNSLIQKFPLPGLTTPPCDVDEPDVAAGKVPFEDCFADEQFYEPGGYYPDNLLPEHYLTPAVVAHDVPQRFYEFQHRNSCDVPEGSQMVAQLREVLGTLAEHLQSNLGEGAPESLAHSQHHGRKGALSTRAGVAEVFEKRPSRSPVFCHTCGKKRTDWHAFCPFCGVDLSA